LRNDRTNREIIIKRLGGTVTCRIELNGTVYQIVNATYDVSTQLQLEVASLDILKLEEIEGSTGEKGEYQDVIMMRETKALKKKYMDQRKKDCMAVN
jgi:hypothetical protein